MREALKLVKILLIIPATNATSERSFSTLRRVKSYLRSNMKQSRLNHLITCNIQKEQLDQLDLKAIANCFVHDKENRMNKLDYFKLIVSVTVAVANQRAVHLRMRNSFIPRPLTHTFRRRCNNAKIKRLL